MRGYISFCKEFWFNHSDNSWSSDFIDVSINEQTDFDVFPEFRYINSISVERDLKTLQITGIVELVMPHDLKIEFVNRQDYAIGESIPVQNIYFNYGGVDFVIKALVDSKYIDHKTGNVELRLSVISFRQDVIGDADYLEEYYVNGYFNPRQCNGSFTKEIAEKTKITVKSADVCVSLENEFESLPCLSTMVMVFELEGSQIIVLKDNISELKESYPISIMYFKKIPVRKTREQIQNLVSLYMGRNLIKIGEASFSKGYSRYVEMVSAFRYESQIKSDRWSFIPANISLDDYVHSVWRRYLEIYDDYNFKLIFDYYWRAISEEIDVAICQLVICYEYIEKCYLKKNNVKKKDNHKQFLKTIDEELQSIRQKIADYPDADSILYNIKTADRTSKRSLKKQFTSSLQIEFENNKDRTSAYDSAMNIKHAELSDSSSKLLIDFIVLLGYVTEIILKLFEYPFQLDFHEEFIAALKHHDD